MSDYNWICLCNDIDTLLPSNIGLLKGKGKTPITAINTKTYNYNIKLLLYSKNRKKYLDI